MITPLSCGLLLLQEGPQECQGTDTICHVQSCCTPTWATGRLDVMAWHTCLLAVASWAQASLWNNCRGTDKWQSVTLITNGHHISSCLIARKFSHVIRCFKNLSRLCNHLLSAEILSPCRKFSLAKKRIGNDFVRKDWWYISKGKSVYFWILLLQFLCTIPSFTKVKYSFCSFHRFSWKGVGNHWCWLFQIEAGVH